LLKLKFMDKKSILLFNLESPFSLTL